DEAKAGKALRKDAGAGKATFVSLMGAEQARQQARALSEQAIGHLQGHGDEAELLRALARFVVERDRCPIGLASIRARSTRCRSAMPTSFGVVRSWSISW